MTELRAEHLRKHVTPKDLPVLWLALEPLTFDEIAANLGITRRGVETAWFRIRDVLLPDCHRQGTLHIQRLALLRVAFGLDPCWCES